MARLAKAAAASIEEKEEASTYRTYVRRLQSAFFASGAHFSRKKERRRERERERRRLKFWSSLAIKKRTE